MVVFFLAARRSKFFFLAQAKVSWCSLLTLPQSKSTPHMYVLVCACANNWVPAAFKQ